MSTPTAWRERAVELRQMATFTADAERQRKLTELAERWEQVASEAEREALEPAR